MRPVPFSLIFLFIAQMCYGATLVKKTKVLILGAGVSGTTAARTLYDAGVEDFLVLEGQDYIGGRLKLNDFQGFKIEEGANWIHGAIEENPLYEIMKKFDFQGIYSNYDDYIVRNASGHDITKAEVIARYKQIVKGLNELSDTRDDSTDISIQEAERSLGWTATTQLEKALERLQIDFEYAMDSSKSSFNGWGFYETDFFVVDPRGYNMFVLDNIKPFQDKVLIKKTVASVKQFASGVQVTTKGGSIYEAEYVLNTFSNNVLTSDMVNFCPPLPRYKLESFERVVMANYTKIWLKFPYKFWDDKEYILYATDNDGGYYHTWQDLSRPGILPEESGVMLMTSTDEVSQRIEAQTTAETLDEIMGILSGVYGQDIPEAEDIFYSRWSQNPYTRGAYANAVVGTTAVDFDNIASNLGRLFFAGDGTTYELFGYLHGALITGKEKAKEMLACIAKKPYPECPTSEIESCSE